MNQRTVALVIVGAITLFLFVAAVVAGWVIGGEIRSVASGNAPCRYTRSSHRASMNCVAATHWRPDHWRTTSNTWNFLRILPTSRQASRTVH